MRVLHLFRPTLPSSRAQAVQVVHTCHALAARGHDVWLFANPTRGDPGSAEAALAGLGLEPLPTLHLELAPTAWNPWASLWFRWRVGRWCDDATRESVVYARELRYLGLVGSRPRVVYEAHCHERQRAEEEGGEAGATEAWERAMFARAGALVANSGGTLAALQRGYGQALPDSQRVCHNATSPDRVVRHAPAPRPLLVFAGSPRAYKGVAGLIEAVAGLPGVDLEFVGDAPPGPLPANVTATGPLPYVAVPGRLARAHALMLPLEDNSFGRQFTSPLKLWDYLATGLPIVAADLPTVRDIAGERPVYYAPGNTSALREAIGRALASAPGPPHLRTWADRAEEIESVLAGVIARRRDGS
ncbi:MAG: glycosyltransferase [Myxococcales bacterium]|nr:glycosyltransferase [Myxococcales bacterium]